MKTILNGASVGLLITAATNAKSPHELFLALGLALGVTWMFWSLPSK